MLVTFRRFGDLFLFGLVWQYSTNQNQSHGYLLTCSNDITLSFGFWRDFAKAKFALNTANFQEASNFCLVDFRAVELLTTEHHQAARSLYAIKGFELIETIEKTYLGGIICFVLYRLRMPCIVTRANLSAWIFKPFIIYRIV